MARAILRVRKIPRPTSSAAGIPTPRLTSTSTRRPQGRCSRWTFVSAEAREPMRELMDEEAYAGAVPGTRTTRAGPRSSDRPASRLRGRSALGPDPVRDPGHGVDLLHHSRVVRGHQGEAAALDVHGLAVELAAGGRAAHLLAGRAQLL